MTITLTYDTTFELVRDFSLSRKQIYAIIFKLPFKTHTHLYQIIIIIIIISKTMYMVLSSWQSHQESSQMQHISMRSWLLQSSQVWKIRKVSDRHTSLKTILFRSYVARIKNSNIYELVAVNSSRWRLRQPTMTCNPLWGRVFHFRLDLLLAPWHDVCGDNDDIWCMAEAITRVTSSSSRSRRGP